MSARTWWRSDGPVAALLVLTALASQLSPAISQSLLGVALLWALLRVVATGDRPARTGLEIPWLLLLAWAALMIPVDGHPGEGLHNFRRFYLFLPLWLGATYLGGERRRLWMLAAFAGGAFVDAVYSVVTETLLTGDYSHRLKMIQHSTITASWIAMAASLLALAWVLRGRGPWKRLPGVVALAPSLAALALTQGRGAWVGFVAGATVMTLAWRRWLLIPLLAALALGFAFGPAPVRTRLSTFLDPNYSTNAQRLALWRSGWDIVRGHPLTGVGDRDLSEFTPVFLEHGPDGEPVHVRHVHQNFLMLAAIWGAPGLVFGTWFLVALGVRLWRRWRELRGLGERAPPWAAVWTLAALGMWTAVLATGLFDWSFGDPELGMVYLLAAGVALAPLAPHSA